MSTRRVAAGSRRVQNGWASAPEFDDLRGLNGTAVAFKAKLLDDPKMEELLYFLQALSLKDGSRRIAREVIEMFPERIGTPTMIKIGCKPGKRLTQKERDEIHEELYGGLDTQNLLAAISDEEYTPEHCQSTADEFLSECRSRLADLDKFIERLCCDPKLAVTVDSAAGSHYHRVAKLVLEDAGQEDEQSTGFELPKLIYFHDILGALLEYQNRYSQQARADFVETSIGKIVFEALDYALKTGRTALIEGSSGFGKTTALKAFCEMNLGRARYVQLMGITHRTGFFKEVAASLGIARGTALSPSKMQTRVEHFLQRTKVMLVIDEGQYLFPPGNRVYTPPELINWLSTACYNKGVPFVISATSEFTKRRAVIERNTTWDSFQLRRRIRRYFALPAEPTKDDLTRVAEKLLPGMGRDAVNYVVGYSMSCKGFFQAITDAIEDARLLAKEQGRDEIKFADLKKAIQEWRSPSDAALLRVFEKKPEGRRNHRASVDSGANIPAETEPILEADNGRLNRLTKPLEQGDRRELSLAAV